MLCILTAVNPERRAANYCNAGERGSFCGIHKECTCPSRIPARHILKLSGPRAEDNPDPARSKMRLRSEAGSYCDQRLNQREILQDNVEFLFLSGDMREPLSA